MHLLVCPASIQLRAKALVFLIKIKTEINIMSQLYNKLSQQELKKLVQEETFFRKTVSFYNYFKIDDPRLFRDELYKALTAINVFGRIYVAEEGINAQVSIPEENFDQFVEILNTTEGLKNLRLNIAVEDDGKSFWVLKIKVKHKIVADGISDPSFSMDNRGKYISANDFNTMVADDDTVIVDMRNHYEYEVGHFKSAIEIPSDTFREQLPMAAELLADQKDKNIIMYCTGGIRCEKASAYMKHAGFENVYHLEGGIIHYTNEVKSKQLENNFVGKNFVFDNRLGERITEDIIAKCHQCGKAADTHVNCANDGCHLLFIQCDECAAAYQDCCSADCMAIKQLPETEQKNLRKGKDNGMHIFNKSKSRKKALG